MNYNRNSILFGLIVLSSIIFFGSAAFKNDPSKLHAITVKNHTDLQSLFTYRGQRMPFVSAHRGGSLRGFPENCIATFENTLKYTHAILEIDPRYTKDSLMVLHHDPTLGRTVDGKGNVISYTLDELRKMNLKDSEGNITKYHMPVFDEVLEWAKGKTILVVDQKDVSAKDRLKKVEEHNAVSNVILIVYSFDDAVLCYNLNHNIIMEVMMPSAEKVLEFDRTGVPWKNVIAFVGHNLPEDSKLYDLIHQRGALCMAGSSRNVDLKFLSGQVTDFSTLKGDYMGFFIKGIDLIETDIPVNLGPLINGIIPSDFPSKKYFSVKSF